MPMIRRLIWPSLIDERPSEWGVTTLQRRLWAGILACLLACYSWNTKAGPALVIEAQTGLVIYSEDADASWHPASLTKLMTAYITFQAIRDGRLSLEDNITCSQHALSQPPSKIGLPVGAELKVDLALKALIIKSANDVAIMLAEKVAGSEAAFVEMMNQTAQRLGMTQTRFFNANGLPNPEQVTTARDMALLAQALLREFPQYSYLYSLPSFKIGNRFMRSHNSLLRTFEGADGMKTGFICASGYNVVASAKRGERQILAVVLGERSNTARTIRAATLIQHGFDTIGWKSMFSTALDQVAVDASASRAPGNLQSVVCQPRRVYTKKQLRKLTRKPKQVAASAPGNAEKKPAASQ
jgi:D-alanyl-D-alanine carboxypeptidase